jgi:putative ABC transport system ATP-binding protein
MLRMTKLSKVYRTHMIETHALRGFEIHVNKGEFVTVTGPSGSGKTSFLNIAGLLEEFTDGEYVLDGVNVKGMDDNARSRLRNEKLGFIFQGFNLIPDLSCSTTSTCRCATAASMRPSARSASKTRCPRSAWPRA